RARAADRVGTVRSPHRHVPRARAPGPRRRARPADRPGRTPVNIPLGISLPHRSPEPIDVAAVRHVAHRADALGFQDLWVTENTLDHVFCFDALTILTY